MGVVRADTSVNKASLKQKTSLFTMTSFLLFLLGICCFIQLSACALSQHHIDRCDNVGGLIANIGRRKRASQNRYQPGSSPPPPCRCVNPWPDDGSWIGMPEHTCRVLGVCYVPVHTDCGDTWWSHTGEHCFSGVACQYEQQSQFRDSSGSQFRGNSG